MTPEEKRLKRNAYQKAWADKNREYYRKKGEDHRKAQTPECKKAHVEYQKQWRRDHPDRNSEHQKRYREKNRDKFRSYSAEYRHQKELASPGWRDTVAIEFHYVMRDELNQLWNADFEVDHIVPLLSDIVCGLHVDYNLQLLDSAENNRKHNTEWPDHPDELPC